MTFTVHEVHAGIFNLVFDLPGEKVNKLSTETLEELEKILDDLKTKPIKALIFSSGKKDLFVAGADLKQFEPAFKDPSLTRHIIETGQRVFRKIETLPFPVIAAIHGACLGGGCELALACSHRIATDHPKTSIGLPETTLGLIPGWGGTQRLPRVASLKTATEMIVTGKPLNGLKAYKIGLVDALVAPEFLIEKAIAFAEHPRKQPKKKGLFYWLIESNPVGRALLFHQVKRQIQKATRGFYPAPLLALEVLQKTAGMPLNQGLEVEKEAFSRIDASIAKNLIALFFGQEALKKGEGLTGGRETKLAGVIGAGTMGGGIAWVFSNKDIPARIKDISWEALGHATHTAWDIYAKLVKSRRLTPNEASMKFHKLSWTIDYSGFNKLEFIVETASENLDLKRQIYRELEPLTSAIIASNTSSLKIADLAAGLAHPERFIGMHFFNPASRMPLVEIIPGPLTSPETIATTFELVKKLGKVPLIVGDCNGFLVNRIFMAAANQAFQLLGEGVSIQQLDEAMLKFGMPMGSCELVDEVGIDVTYKVAKVFEEAYGARMQVPPLLHKLYEAKLLGKKSNRGFYLYNGQQKRINKEAERVQATFRGKKGYSDDEIVERIMLAMINEASRCLEEGIVKKPAHIDLAMILGTGFPPFRGGLLAYADTLGTDKIYQRLLELEGAPFTPTHQIAELASRKGYFYDRS